MNLVMIGRFATPANAEAAKDALDQLTRGAQADQNSAELEIGGNTSRFSDQMLEVLASVKVYGLSPADVEQFCYDARLAVKDVRVILRTDETDVQAYLKVLLEKGARVEIFSAHDYPDDDEVLGAEGLARRG